MSSLTKQHMGQYVYIYEATSYWDRDNQRTENYKRSIGRIDAATGEEFYKQWYIDRLNREGKPTDEMQVWVDLRTASGRRDNSMIQSEIELAQEILDTVKDYGTAYFLQSIAQKIGLIETLERTIPRCWRKILILACYLVAENKPVMYCSDWVEENECMDAGNMASQRISELLTMFGYNERTGFYRQWYEHIRENEYIALDITSVSSYSENIDFMEWGYNRDGEDLPQVNICMLFGEKSMLPVYQTVYSGSLGDVSTLKTTLSEFSAITGGQDIMLIMDKGFFSAKNVNMMLGKNGDSPYKFLIPVSFKSKFAINQVNGERNDIDCIENVVFTSGSPIRGVHKHCDWGKSGNEIHTHIFFNPEKATKDRNELYGRVAHLKIQASKKKIDREFQKEIQHYLLIQKSNNPNESDAIEIRKNIIQKELETAGWFVLISNRISDIQTAYDMYRAKDAVEKSFFQYKKNLGLNRFHVHNDERLLNKTFVAFIALILSSYIHSIMRKTQLDRCMTFDKLLIVLSKLKAAFVSGTMVLRPLTKGQKDIFDAFGIEHPGQ